MREEITKNGFIVIMDDNYIVKVVKDDNIFSTHILNDPNEFDKVIISVEELDSFYV